MKRRRMGLASFVCRRHPRNNCFRRAPLERGGVPPSTSGPKHAVKCRLMQQNVEAAHFPEWLTRAAAAANTTFPSCRPRNTKNASTHRNLLMTLSFQHLIIRQIGLIHYRSGLICHRMSVYTHGVQQQPSFLYRIPINIP